ncbi:MAG: ankyrin repeat domain-containing protein [Actinobacteria bacterium]|nr:MAG: ankyrin repeat domain-containing protein [Actinomycetota bacterium]
MDDQEFNQIEHLTKKGDLLGLRAWLDGGGDPNLSNEFGWTPLMLAALHGRTDFAQALVSRGADPDRQNEFGDTAKALALAKGFASTARAMESST